MIRNDIVHLSYRLGIDCRPPEGFEGVPFVVFGYSLAGSAGFLVRVKASCRTSKFRSIEDVGSETEGPNGESEWCEAFFVPPGYFRRHTTGLGVKEEGVQRHAMYRAREIVEGKEGARRAVVRFVLSGEGVARADESAREQLAQLLACKLRDEATILFDRRDTVGPEDRRDS